jgi:phosphatidylserine/phosphatidylglycerophosphate/cardiolipin synthase-like enzyme
MKLLIQPEDGVAPLVKGINDAKTSIDIVIFRFDRSEIEKALLNAVGRGVRVRALIASTNRGGEKSLRALEARLLAVGITVARTADDLVRYHGKMIIIDGRELYLLAFNFTYLDIDHSRSFGVIARDRKLVREALRLFEADMQRQAYTCRSHSFLVSPVNARKELAAFLKAAKKELLIYDPCISDTVMLRLLQSLSKEGLSIRVIGRAPKLGARKLIQVHLHARTIVRDGTDVFVGSQSLRAAELDTRREIGILFSDAAIAGRITKLFNQDWELAEPSALAEKGAEESVPAEKIAKKVAKAMTKGLPAVVPALEAAITEVAGAEVPVNSDKLQDSVKDAVKHAVKEAIRDVVERVAAVEESGKGM